MDALRPEIRNEVKKRNPIEFEPATQAAINVENALNDSELNVNYYTSFVKKYLITISNENEFKIAGVN